MKSKPRQFLYNFSIIFRKFFNKSLSTFIANQFDDNLNGYWRYYLMQKSHIGVISVIAVLLLIACTAYADTGVRAVPEVQGLSTSTGMNVQGTVTETDAGAWTLTNDPAGLNSQDWPPGSPVLSADEFAALSQQLQSAGGSVTAVNFLGSYVIAHWNVPSSLLNTPIIVPNFGPVTFGQAMDTVVGTPVTTTEKGFNTGVLDPGQVQYTAGYNDQYAGVSGQQTFVKSMALSTANKIADQSNIKANTNIQFIAMDTGRATRSEDLLLDGAAQAQDSSSLILCPFANANPGIIPAFCNIEQAGSAFDTTLTSTVTSADTRFVGGPMQLSRSSSIITSIPRELPLAISLHR